MACVTSKAKPRVSIELFVVYHDTIDFPGKYVVRRWVYDKPDTQPVIVSSNLRMARFHVPTGYKRFPRGIGDDQVIVEYWM